MKIISASFLTSILFFSFLTAAGQWSADPAINTGICNETDGQYNPIVVSDGAGGAIITWWDGRRGNSESDIYAQRINSAGAIQWKVGGEPISTVNGAQAHSPNLVSDGAGGAIITWIDARTPGRGIYAQRINASGAVQWATNGIPICNINNFISGQSMIADGAGGAYIGWPDGRSGSGTTDVYAQWVNASGVVQWTVNGVSVCKSAYNQSSPGIALDGSGGIFLTWTDFRNGNNWDIYAQRLDGSGTVQWTINGSPVAVTLNDQLAPKLIYDGNDAAIITWNDDRSTVSGVTDIYAQRIDLAGAVQWAVNGLVVCNAPGFQQAPEIISDNTGGAVMCWSDSRGSSTDIYAQRIDSSGAGLWATNGVLVCGAPDIQSEQQMISDNINGAIITWQDSRNGLDEDIYAQHIDGSGIVSWTPNGVAICTAANNQFGPVLTGNGADGAIIAWQDNRNAGVADIYAQHINDLLPPKPDTVELCGGQPILLTSGFPGNNIWQWQINTGNGYTNISNDANYSGVTSDTLHIFNPPTSWYGNKYRCVVNNVSLHKNFMLQFISYWTGVASTAWENTANWSCGSLPDLNTDVRINTGMPNYPVVNTNTSCRSVQSNGAASTLTIKTGVSLTLTGH